MSKKTRKKTSSPSARGATSAKPGAKPGSEKRKSQSAPTSKKETAPAVRPKTTAPSRPQLGEGVRAPSFRLPRDGGGMVSLSDFAGQKLVLFFYPRANTPGCTREAVDFTRLSDAFARSGTVVLGISADPPKAQEAFRDKHGLSVPLLSDETHTTLQAYGAWGEKSLYGRTFLGLIRTTVLIGGNGRIRRIWRHVKVDGHAEAVLAAATAAD